MHHALICATSLFDGISSKDICMDEKLEPDYYCPIIRRRKELELTPWA